MAVVLLLWHGTTNPLDNKSLSWYITSMAKVSDHLQHEAEFRGENTVLQRSKPRIVICGVGSLGSKLLDLLASQGYTNLAVIDKDRVEGKNFGTQNYGLADVGRMKAQQAAANLFRRLRVKIESYSQELRASNAKSLLKGDLVIDVFDNAESRNLVRDHCREHKIACLHAGLSDDGFAEVEWNDNYRAHPVPEESGEEIPCEYPLASNLVAFTVALTAEVVNKFFGQGIQQSIHFTLNDLHVDKVGHAN